jgi:hypothetical protein
VGDIVDIAGGGVDEEVFCEGFGDAASCWDELVILNLKFGVQLYWMIPRIPHRRVNGSEAMVEYLKYAKLRVMKKNRRIYKQQA